jgi:hypothetical protein
MGCLVACTSGSDELESSRDCGKRDGENEIAGARSYGVFYARSGVWILSVVKRSD